MEKTGRTKLREMQITLECFAGIHIFALHDFFLIDIKNIGFSEKEKEI